MSGSKVVEAGLEWETGKVRKAGERGRWAVFGCCDSDYAPRLLVALSSVRRTCPEMSAYLFSPGCGAAELRVAEREGIRIIPEDPSQDFDDARARGSWRWPKQSFGHLVAWRKLHALGYDRSLSIDGDVWCGGPLPLRDLNGDDFDLAGVCNGSVGGHLRVAESAPDALLSFGTSWPGLWSKAPNTGVLIWNHRRLEEQHFAERIVRLFQENADRIWIPSDQHLLALAIATDPLKLRWLDTRWNFCCGEETGGGHLHLVPPIWRKDSWIGELREIFLLHLFKPWKLLDGGEWGVRTAASGHLVHQALTEWCDLAEDLYGSSWAESLGCPLGPARAKPIPENSRKWALRRRVCALCEWPIMVTAQGMRELHTVVGALRHRAPQNLHPSLLSRLIPALLPQQMLREAMAHGSFDSST